jgi:hypothetical protein
MSELRGPDVVALWGAGNGALLGILIGYGDNPWPMALYGGSVALIELVALITWWVLRRHEVWAHASPAPRPTRAALLAGEAVALVGAGIVWDWWIALPALYPLGALVLDFATGPGGPMDLPSAEPSGSETGPARTLVAAGAVVAGAEVLRRRRRNGQVRE